MSDWKYRTLAEANEEIERLQAEFIESCKGQQETERLLQQTIERLQKECEDKDRVIRAGINTAKRLRSALEAAHDVLANGGDLKTDTYQTRCNRALAITREALHTQNGDDDG